MSDQVSQKLSFMNVTPIFIGNEGFTASEIRRQYHEVGLREFALSLSIHPQGNPPRKRVDTLIGSCRKLRELLADLPDLQLGILIQSTMGHGWASSKPLTDEPWSRIRQLVSETCEPLRFYDKTSRMCYMDPEFQDYILYGVREIMKLGPAFLLLDDDFGLRDGECFCDSHVADFNEHNHSHYTREELAKIVLERPFDDPEVRLFCERRGAAAVDFLRRIRQTIDAFDPKIRCVLCTCARGFADRFLATLAGPESQPCARIGSAIYGDCQPLRFYHVDWRTNMNKYRCGHKLSRPAAFFDEADTFPQSYYSESAMMYHAHLTLAILNGLSGAKLWMSEFNLPENRNWQSRYEKIFRDHRGFYEELFRVSRNMTPLGVFSPVFDAPEMDHPFLCRSADDSLAWSETFLGPFGVPLGYGDGSGGGVYALTGNDAAHLTDEQIRRLLAGAVLLDGSAAAELTRRGFAADMGVRTVEDPAFFFQSELVQGSGRSLGLMWEKGMVKLEVVSPETQVRTWCASGSARAGGELKIISPCMTFFTNASGGRTAVTAYPAAMPYYKRFRPPRRELLFEALDFLNGGMLEMTVEILNHELVHHGRLEDGSELVALLGLGMDAAPEIPLRCAREVRELRRLDDSGCWVPTPFRQTEKLLTVEEELRLCDWKIFRLRF